jgi:predicted  nucleic acid-binding Zn-ribbon protein
MSSKDSHSQEYEVTDHDQIVPVASQGLLISQILERLEALEGTVAELRDENRQKDQRIADLEARLEDHESFDGRERATDRQRITALETPAPALREETAKDHVDRLFSEMRRLKMRYVTIKDAARLLEISKPHMHKLKPYLADDSRFAVIKDPHHSQRHLIGIV